MRPAILFGVRMIPKPTRNGIVADAQNLADTKPAEEYVSVRSVGAISVSAANEVDFTEPTKEQEQVTGANTHAMEMTLRDAVLTKGRQPPGLSTARSTIQVGIEVSGIRCRHTVPSQVCDNVADVESAGVQTAVGDRAFAMRYRQRNHLAVRQNRARATAGSRR